ncbi:thiamine-phosphate kinase [Bdellovibrionota bacterium FG-2]
MEEFEFIAQIARKFSTLVPPGTLGIGDDCAVLPGFTGENERLLVTTDLLTEGVHFFRAKSQPQDIGYKALAVNLSDIAAMGGRPTAFFLSLALPKNLEPNWARLFLKGLHKCATEFHTPLLGGDTTGSETSITINICVLGRANSTRIKLRSGACVGDVICVTGFLGDSAGGLGLVKAGASVVSRLSARDQKSLLRAHFRPRPRLDEGTWLACHSAVHAMMDVSDGIHSDLPHILEASQCGAMVFVDDLPISGALARFCKAFRTSPVQVALMGGEDYCLLCTVNESAINRVSGEFKNRFGRPLFQIGRVTANPGRLEYFEQGRRVKPKGHPFRHFG